MVISLANRSQIGIRLVTAYAVGDKKHIVQAVYVAESTQND